MEAAARIVAETLELMAQEIAVGVTTLDLDRMAEEYIRKQGAVPAFKGYSGYPATICASVNSEVIHGIPSSKRVLAEGDIVGVDVGAVLDGYMGDAARTFAVGKVSAKAESLMLVTREALMKGVEQASDGNRVSDISHAVQSHVEAAGFSVVKKFAGHGIGKNLHEKPEIANYGSPGRGARLRSGMTLAIEPMVNAGGDDVKVLGDGWTVVTTDGDLSAHFEHTVLVTPEGGRPLTVLG